MKRVALKGAAQVIRPPVTLEFSMTLSMQSKYESSLTGSFGFSSRPLTACVTRAHHATLTVNIFD